MTGQIDSASIDTAVHRLLSTGYCKFAVEGVQFSVRFAASYQIEPLENWDRHINRAFESVLPENVLRLPD